MWIACKVWFFITTEPQALCELAAEEGQRSNQLL